MKLYHGSNMTVERPMILKADRKLDFGTGFYLTASREQAVRWAMRTTERRGCGVATVSVYEFNEELMRTIAVKSFTDADGEWLRYVSANRNGDVEGAVFDLIVGLVANDQTMPTINLFLMGYLDEEMTIRRLKPQKLQNQYVFKSDRALAGLKFERAEIL